jgi:hypothetical protein
MNTTQEHSNNLPISGNLALAYAVSLVIALLMAAASTAGCLYGADVYPTDELLQSFMPNDVVNLLIGVPILLGSMWLARRGQLIGLLFWPGALLYVLYNYLAYVFAMPVGVQFMVSLTLATLSTYAIIGLVASIDATAVRQRLVGAVPERPAGSVLVGLGTLFCLRAIGVLVGALVNQTPIGTTELAVLISDFVTSPASIIGGVLLWRRKPLGYVAGMGLLFQTSMLFVGLILFMLLQPLLTAAPFSLADVVVVFIMGLVSFVPFALFVRGVVSRDSSSSPIGRT